MAIGIHIDFYSSTAERLHNLGELVIDKWGRKFRYVQAGGSDLVTGDLIQEAAEVTNFRSMVVQAASAPGDKTIAITLGGTAVTANQFDEGDLTIESAAGIGQNFKIISHDVQTSTTGTCIFTVDRPVETALTTSSQASVRKSSYDGVIQWPVTPTGAPVGVAIFIVADTEYGWIQSGGDVSVLFDNQDNTAADDVGIVPSEDVAGSVSAAQAADAAPTNIGWGREIASTDSTHGFAHLTID
jgi:hypothetical protein